MIRIMTIGCSQIAVKESMLCSIYANDSFCVMIYYDSAVCSLDIYPCSEQFNYKT